MINSRTQSLDGKTVNELNKGFLLCAEYFESSQFMNAEQHKSLIHNAVPATFNVSILQSVWQVHAVILLQQLLFQLRRLGYRLQNKWTPEKLHV